LGKPLGEGEKALLGPGLHWSFPYPIDEYIKVPISAIQKANSSVGWYATTPEMEQAGTDDFALPIGTPLNPVADGYAMTADKNIVHSRVTLTYHISDPVGYIFNFKDAAKTVQSAIDNALLHSAAQFNVDDILTRDVAGFREAVRKRVIELVEKQNLGIVVEECIVQSRAPRQLKEAFENVLQAEVARGKVLNQALSYENEITNRANADAQSLINAAQTERVRLVQDVNSQAERFKELLPKYRENPSLFVQQRLTETLGRVLTNAQDKILFSQGPNGKERELRLLLNRESPKKTEDKKS